MHVVLRSAAGTEILVSNVLQLVVTSHSRVVNVALMSSLCDGPTVTICDHPSHLCNELHIFVCVLLKSAELLWAIASAFQCFKTFHTWFPISPLSTYRLLDHQQTPWVASRSNMIATFSYVCPFLISLKPVSAPKNYTHLY